ncbi:MAG: DNA-binding protein [Ketobacter sp.]|nr:DNA-binding protein [Ketobacter sp.]
MPLRTPDEVRDELKSKGISISQWAAANGFSVNMVFEVLAGRKKGVRGQAHNIAVKLGLKEGEVIEGTQAAIANALTRRTA